MHIKALIITLTEQDEHLEGENVDIEAVVLQPGVLVHDVAEEARVQEETHEEHHTERVAGLESRIGAAIAVGRSSPREQTHCRVHEDRAVLLAGCRRYRRRIVQTVYETKLLNGTWEGLLGYDFEQLSRNVCH
jgi:hypothetical protein